MIKMQPEVGIYVGEGASHSWTWFADIFEREAYTAVCFLDERDIAAGALTGVDVLFISGGDTFAIAQGLGKSGADAIEKFVRCGGIYIGACAGAYLPLNSSLPPLNLFNFVATRISNLTKDLPEAVAKPEKFCTEYGCRYVYHPVRESVQLRLSGWGRDGQYVEAPLYGGPALLPSDDAVVLAEYVGFTDSTEFLIDPEIAGRALLGTAAAIKKDYGRGSFYLFGPHFEHPDYHEANSLLFEIFTCMKTSQRSRALCTVRQSVNKKQYLAFLSAVSNARIMALALERTAFIWLIGRKVYDPEKIRVFTEAIWQRARQLEAPECLACIESADIGLLTAQAIEVARIIQKLRNDGQPRAQETACAERLFLTLRTAAAAFLTIYFRLQRGGVLHQQRRSTCTIATCISLQPQCSIR
jgi:glutamine amidotransferase-like uncharacterized protein